ncbi:MAG: ammonium transporter [Actinobacteria bacterium]|nr:ammonium transporter [Actinomycetota bacterium]
MSFFVAATTGAGGSVDPGATAWVIVATALVMLMTPGVAFFYSGMVRAKHVLGMLMQSLMAMAAVSLVWLLVGYTLAFGEGNGLIGDLRFAGLLHMDEPVPGFSGADALVIPPLLFAAFQMMFAVITPALVTGATADRWRFRSFTLFVVVWTVLVYAPVAHWVFSPDGWAARLGVRDFAGGLVVHVNAGAAGLAMALVLGRRTGWLREPMRPHNLPIVLLGASLLWFGWFGFNGGSALRADGVAVAAVVNTHVAACAALAAWVGVERVRYGKSTTLGAASGAVSGLVAITPAAGYVTPLSAVVIGLLAGVVCAFAVSLKLWFRLDDSLDVVGVHLVGGALGSLAVGLLATEGVSTHAGNGLFYGGGYDLLLAQATGLVVVTAYSFGVTYGIGRVIDRFVGNRVPLGQERKGLDLAVHGESAYDLDSTTTTAPAPAGAGDDRNGGPVHVSS